MQGVNRLWERLSGYFLNTSWMVFERFFTLGLNFLISIVLARHLGVSDFGIFSYAVSLVALFSVAGHVGLSGILVKEFVSKSSDRLVVLQAGFLLKSSGYLLGVILLICFSYMTGEGVESVVLVILACGLLFQALEIVDFYFQSEVRAKLPSIARMVAISIASLVKLFGVFLGMGIIYFAASNVLYLMLLGLGFSYVFVRYANVGNVFAVDWGVVLLKAKSLLGDGALVFLGSIFALIYMKIDQVMLKWMVGSEAVGVYSVAAVLSEAWYFIPVAVVSSLFPRLVNLRESGDEIGYYKNIQVLMDFLFWLAFLVALLIGGMSDFIIVSFYGPEYADAGGVLAVHIWASVFVFMRALLSRWIIIEKVLVFSVVTQGMGALFNIVLNWFLIPEYQEIGAAYATLVSYAVAGYFSLLLSRKTRKMFWIMSRAVFGLYRMFVWVRTRQVSAK